MLRNILLLHTSAFDKDCLWYNNLSLRVPYGIDQLIAAQSRPRNIGEILDVFHPTNVCRRWRRILHVVKRSHWHQCMHGMTQPFLYRSWDQKCALRTNALLMNKRRNRNVRQPSKSHSTNKNKHEARKSVEPCKLSEKYHCLEVRIIWKQNKTYQYSTKLRNCSFTTDDFFHINRQWSIFMKLLSGCAKNASTPVFVKWDKHLIVHQLSTFSIIINIRWENVQKNWLKRWKF